jgi:tetratricopeptide (TPR) repeat protein
LLSGESPWAWLFGQVLQGRRRRIIHFKQIVHSDWQKKHRRRNTIADRQHQCKRGSDRPDRGTELKAQHEIEPAIALIREALALADRHEFPAREWVVEHLADALNLQGLERQKRGDLDGAMKGFLESLEIWRQRGSPYNEGQTLINIGNTQVVRKQDAEAAGTFQCDAAALLLAKDREGADRVALMAGELCLWVDRLDQASTLFREIVNRATGSEERADRMNRIGALAERQLELGAINRALRVLKDCFEWNQEDGLLPDAAEYLISIGSILKAAGDPEGGRQGRSGREGRTERNLYSSAQDMHPIWWHC